MRTISKLHFNRIIYGTDGQISEINKNDCIEDVFVCDTIKVYENTSLPERNCYGIIWFNNIRTHKLFYHRFIDSSTSIDYLIDEEDEPLTHIYRNPLNTNEYLCDINLITDAYCIKQNLLERMSNVRGDLPYNIELGVPLKFTRQSSRLIILNLINGTPGVTGCDVVKEYISNKKYVMDVQVHTQFGTFTVTV